MAVRARADGDGRELTSAPQIGSYGLVDRRTYACTIDIPERAFRSTGAVLASVGADQLDAPTPCGGWSVRRIVRHLIGSARWYAVCAETGRDRSGWRSTRCPTSWKS